MRTSYIGLILCVLAQGVALHVAYAAEPRESQATPSSTHAVSVQASSRIPSSRIALPDDGPRYDRSVEGPGALQFQEAVKAFTNGQYPVARAGFAALATLDSTSELIPPLKAFLAELILLEDPTDHGRREAITQYRSISGSYPKNANAFRALWRIGDLYAEMGWFQDAIAAYEYALSRELPHHDADRSLLALGVTLGELGRWTDADRAFDTVRERAIDDRLVVRATLDQANALYAQRRKRDAVPLYEFLYRRWPNILTQNPDALQQYGDALFEVQELRKEHDIDLLLYNMFPSHRHAGMALVRLGDSHSRLGQHTAAELFYTAAQTQYPDTASAVVARMRMSRKEQEIAASAGENFLRKKVEGMIRGGGISYLESSEGEELYKAIALEHQGDMLGSEALVRLAEHYELRGNPSRAIQVYQDVTRRTGVIPHDPWPSASELRLTSILKPQLEAALKSKNDVQALTLFHSHGQTPEQYYIGTQTLLEVADTHRRLGFSSEAVHLYQTLVRNKKVAPLHEAALIGLGESYLDQFDPAAARNVFESFRLQHPQSARSTLVSRQLTTAMLEQGDRRGAIRVMRHWTRAHPHDAAHGWMYVTLARTLAEDQKQEEAVSAFEDALRNHALRAPQDLLLYADLLLKLKKPERAVDVYRQVLKSGPDPAEAEWARVQIMLNPGGKNRKADRSTDMLADAEFHDPLFRRAAGAMQIGLQSTMVKEGE
ncbi:MAG TPA: tetratricopeptide repeat protein [Nitrospiraceae bacterium]|nr:tetratricopeptide repeat protein [Nitrospiraceae bacterium]